MKHKLNVADFSALSGHTLQVNLKKTSVKKWSRRFAKASIIC